MESFKSIFGIFLIVYPIIKSLLHSQGIDLPDLGPGLEQAGQVGGVALVAQAEPLLKKKNKFR